jgi:hypothetical protein
MQRLKAMTGVTQFVSGPADEASMRLRGDPRLAFPNDRDYGALRLDLRRGVGRVCVRVELGKRLDSGTLRCHESSPGGALAGDVSCALRGLEGNQRPRRC